MLAFAGLGGQESERRVKVKSLHLTTHILPCNIDERACRASFWLFQANRLVSSIFRRLVWRRTAPCFAEWLQWPILGYRSLLFHCNLTGLSCSFTLYRGVNGLSR